MRIGEIVLYLQGFGLYSLKISFMKGITKMIKITTTSRHLHAAIELASSGHFSVCDGKSSFNAEWEPRVAAISYAPIPGSKNRIVTFRMKGVSIYNAKTTRPVLGLHRENCCLTAYDGEDNPIMLLPVIELQCVSDDYFASPLSDEERGA